MRLKRPMFLSSLCVVIAAILAYHWLPAPTHVPITYTPDHGQPTIVCLGDSLTAGDGAPPDQSYPAWLQRELDLAHLTYRVINAGVSGNRVADGLHRLKTGVLSFHPKIVIVELGSNDPGHIPGSIWMHQLDAIVARLQANRVRVILAGLDEPGMGDLYRHVAARRGVPLVWFIAQVAGLPRDWHDLHHPNGAGYRVVMQSFWPVLAPILHST